jgi:TPR repeat protein
MFNLSICYYYGQGVEKNLEKAFLYYKKSAKLGDADSMNNLAIFLENVHRIQQNYSEAFRFFKNLPFWVTQVQCII